MAVASTEERLSRLEGGYEHVATQADLLRLENRMMSHISQLETRLTTGMAQLESRLMRWMISLMVGVAMVALAAIGIFVQTLLNLILP